MSILTWVRGLFGPSLAQRAELDRMNVVEEEWRRDEQTDKVMVVERPRSRFDDEVEALQRTVTRLTLYLQDVLKKYQNKSQELERLKQQQDRSLLQAHERILMIEDSTDELSGDLGIVTEKLRVEREYGKGVATQCEAYRRLYEKSKATIGRCRIRNKKLKEEIDRLMSGGSWDE